MLRSKRSLVLPLLGLAVACVDEPVVEGMASPAMAGSSGTTGGGPNPADDDDDAPQDDDDDDAPQDDDDDDDDDAEGDDDDDDNAEGDDDDDDDDDATTTGGMSTTGGSTDDGTTGGETTEGVDPILDLTTGDVDPILDLTTGGVDPVLDLTTGGETGDTGDTGDTDGGTTGEDDPLAGFEAPEPFGDNVVELDLIGTWHLPTDGAAGSYAMDLEIGADGAFRWTEYDDACGLVREGTGVLWVNGGSLSMLFETFTGIAPWDTFSQFGFDSTAPFLLRSGYAPVLGHVAITAPPGIRVAEPWASLGFSRTVGGSTAEDVWVSETELWDIRPGDETATIIARDRHTLDISGGEAWHTINHWWFENDMQLTGDPNEYYLYPYSDDLVGNLTLNGEHFVYVGSAMASFEPGDNFQLDAPSPCD